MAANYERNLENIISTEKKAYDSDFDKMIREFKTEEKKHKQLMEYKSKMRNLNRRWKKSLEKMQEKRESSLSQERKKVLDKMDKRKGASVKRYKQEKEKKQQFITELQVKSKDAVQALKDKVNLTMKEQENERLYLEEVVKEKLDKFSSKNKENLDGIKKKFEDRIGKSVEKFNENYSVVLMNSDQKMKDLREQPIVKYEDWYITHFAQVLKEKENKKREKRSKERKLQDNFGALEDNRIGLGKKILKKLKDTEIKRNQLLMEKSEQLHKKSIEHHEKYLKSLETRLTNKEEKHKKDQEVLERQFQHLNKAKSIESCFVDSKSTILERNTLTRMDCEKKFSNFLKTLDGVKTQSLLKKNS